MQTKHVVSSFGIREGLITSTPNTDGDFRKTVSSSTMIRQSLNCALFCTVATTLSTQDATFTTGLAREINLGLFDCGERARLSAVGEITSDDGTVWTVPAAT